MSISIGKLAIAVTFFYNEDKFSFLQKIFSQYKHLAKSVDAHIITNSCKEDQHCIIRSLLNEADIPITIHCPTLLGHPYLLCWSHLSVFRTLFAEDNSITHFLYVEDDILIRKRNIIYWLEGREMLREYGLIPSFLRYEKKDDDFAKYSTDITFSTLYSKLLHTKAKKDYVFINFHQPYQGLYLLDRELMAEHLNGPSSNPDSGIWSIREKAAQGLTYANVPEGFYSRNLVGFDTLKFSVDPECLVHHLPNNYANNPGTPFGKIPYQDLVLR